ncbi:MAG: pyridoxamine 5'-phosphate oxidase family protein [Actinomycetota bacterium]
MSSTAPLSLVESVARPIVERVVWATIATVGPNGQPRTRLMHPVWFWNADVPTALVSARPTPLKIRHLATHPTVSCHYWDPAHDTVAIDAEARWVPAGERHTAWEQVKAVPEPVGFDPAMIWPNGSASDDCAFLSLVAHRIVAQPARQAAVRWQR